MNPQHIHVSAVTAVTVFLMVGIVGLFWRLASIAMAGADSPALQSVGGAMALFF